MIERERKRESECESEQKKERKQIQQQGIKRFRKEIERGYNNRYASRMLNLFLPR